MNLANLLLGILLIVASLGLFKVPVDINTVLILAFVTGIVFIVEAVAPGITSFRRK